MTHFRNTYENALDTLGLSGVTYRIVLDLPLVNKNKAAVKIVPIATPPSVQISRRDIQTWTCASQSRLTEEVRADADFFKDRPNLLPSRVSRRFFADPIRIPEDRTLLT